MLDEKQENTETNFDFDLKADISDDQTFPIQILADISGTFGIKTFADAIYLKLTDGKVSLPNLDPIEQSISSYITLLSDKWIQLDLEGVLPTNPLGYSLDANTIFETISSSLAAYPLLSSTNEGELTDGQQVFTVGLNNDGIIQLISSFVSI